MDLKNQELTESGIADLDLDPMLDIPSGPGIKLIDYNRNGLVDSVFINFENGMSGDLDSRDGFVQIVGFLGKRSNLLQSIKAIDPRNLLNQATTYELVRPVKVSGQDINTVIVGTKNKDKIIGTSAGEVLAGMKGKDVLKGGKGADGFLFNQPGGSKHVDTINDFSASEGDSILVDLDFFDLTLQEAFVYDDEFGFESCSNRKETIKAAKSEQHIIYNEAKGLLYINENGGARGWGDGGPFAKLKGAPELTESDFTMIYDKSDW